jgi:GNAT superfamily N-acetyltransferase
MSIARCRFPRIRPLRALFVQELNAQVRYDAAHGRRGTAWYVVQRDGRDIGYGSVKDTHETPGTVFEYYVVPAFRADALKVLRHLIDVGEVVATGGFLLHYNPSFADLYMEVRSDARRRGYGSFLIQEIVAECYLAGRVPAARTGIDNIASQRTLLKGGLRECGRMLRAALR